VQHELATSELHPLIPYVFAGHPLLKPEYRHVQEIIDQLEETESAVPIVVGSGTLNDIVKYAAHEAKRPYIAVGTAASMDGYTSSGAAMLLDGYKKSVRCEGPAVVVADTEILRNAPLEMTAAGYGDLIAKIPAGVDWIIADQLNKAPIDPRVWDLVQPNVRDWTRDPDALRRGEAEAFERLFEGLTLTGFTIQIYDDSRPASGSEHFFSHIWEMEHLSRGDVPVSHGFKVAIGSLATTAMAERVFARDLTQDDVERAVAALPGRPEREREVQKGFGGMHAEEQVSHVSLEKLPDAATLRARLEALLPQWESLRERVRAQALPFDELKHALRAAGCPTEPEHIGLTRERLRASFARAQMIRDRYSVLDLAYDLGWFSECVQEIFASNTYFGSPR
jgi:glycerol-1-phosphate dehydrogenase [NAD(P)+]